MFYRDSRGAAVLVMSPSDALEAVSTLAASNLPDEHDIAREPALAADLVWQAEALRTVAQLLSHRSAEMNALRMPSAARDWSAEVVHADRGDDPGHPDVAIRIVLAMAEHAATDPMEGARDIALAEQCDVEQQALDVVRDLLGSHGSMLRTW